jgi:hypothetical protein
METHDHTFGVAARTLGEYLKREDVYRDIVYAGMPSYKPDWEMVITLRERLHACGYKAWLDG